MDFSYPYLLFLLIPWAVMVWRMLRTSHTKGCVFASASARFAAVRSSWRLVAARIAPWAAAIGALAMIIGAAGPRKQLAREVRTADSLAVMMAVDISGSMMVLDFSTPDNEKTRLDVVKEQFRTFVKQRPDDLIGLVTFGGYASVRSPLTADHRALLHTLAGVEVPNPEKGDERGRPVLEDELMTAIGDGLATSLLRLKDAVPKTKIVILLSDGENNAGAVTPSEAANIAKEYGIRVYTVGVGTTGMAAIRQTGADGISRIYQTPTRLDEATLRAIAAKTDAEYANVRSPKQLETFLNQISQLETTRVERQIYARYESCARPWFLSGLLLCLLSSGILTALLRRPL